jgi:Tripartite tricarboxylate transporter TctB family
MSIDLLRNRDFWAGLMLISIGSGAMLLARDYAFGTSLRMGPGYFPSVLGGVLVLFGLVLAVRGWRSGERIEPGWSLRALVILPLAFVLFGLLIERAGFVPALFVLIVAAAAASRESNLREVILLALFLTLTSVAVFIWALGLPYRLFPGS